MLVSFLAESDPGHPLAEVSISIEERAVGSSDEHGLLQTVLSGGFGQKLAARYVCPEGYRAEREAVDLQFPDPAWSETGLSSVEIALRCQPDLRTVAIAVRAKAGAGLPVLLNGELVAETNATGISHFATEAAPGDELVVELDTTKQPNLRPRSPRRHFVVRDREEAFVLTQSFHRLRKKTRRPARPFRIIKIE
jgi:hypothetical protein